MTAESAQVGVRAETNDDLDLVQASKNGDVAAFEQLVKRYDRKLFRIAQSVTHNQEDSQDAVQETFLKAYQHLAEFRGDSQFSTWLIRITLNQSLMKLRKQRATREVSLDEDFGTDEDMLPGRSSIGLPMPKNSTAYRNYETFYLRPSKSCGRFYERSSCCKISKAFQRIRRQKL
jgi:RNA polymerase sigma-70 factor (ECF subfamily)